MHRNKLVFKLYWPLRPCLIFVSKVRSLPKDWGLVRAPLSLTIQILVWKGLAMANTSNLYDTEKLIILYWPQSGIPTLPTSNWPGCDSPGTSGSILGPLKGVKEKLFQYWHLLKPHHDILLNHLHGILLNHLHENICYSRCCNLNKLKTKLAVWFTHLTVDL